MAQLFSIFLTCLALGLGLIWLIDHFYFAPKRRKAAASAMGIAVSELKQEPELPYIVIPRIKYFQLLRLLWCFARFCTSRFRSRLVQ